MSIESSVLTVSTTTYPTTPQFDPGFPGAVSAVLMTQPANGIVFLSLDGTKDHVKLQVGTPSLSWISSWDYSKVWLRTPAGVAIDVQVQIESRKV